MACFILLRDLLNNEDPGGVWKFNGHSANIGGPFNGTPSPGWVGGSPWTPGSTVAGGDNPNLDFTGAQVGYYSFKYIFDNPGSSCDAETNTQLQVVHVSSAGVAGATQVYCTGSTNTVDLFSLIDNEDTGCAWAKFSGPATPNYSNGQTTVNLTGLGVGTYVWSYTCSPTGASYTVSGCANCTPTQSFGTIMIVTAPNSGTATPSTVCN